MEVQVKFIKQFGRHKKGDEIMVHPNMKAHLIKIGVIEGSVAKRPTQLSEEKPIVFQAVAPVKIEEPIEEVKPVEVKTETKAATKPTAKKTKRK
jgi:hypothetical protein